MRLPEEPVDAAKATGLALDPTPVILTPQARLVELVTLAQQKALADEGGEASGD